MCRSKSVIGLWLVGMVRLIKFRGVTFGKQLVATDKAVYLGSVGKLLQQKEGHKDDFHNLAGWYD